MILNWLEYHDELTDVNYELPNFTMEGYDTQDDFYYENNLIVNSYIFSCIEFAIVNSLQRVPCFLLDEFVMLIERDLFKEKLENCLVVFEKNEAYEKCAQVLKLQKLL